MKLLNVELVGYKGIFNGLGLTKLKIDLSQSKNRIVMIKGDNGSGKSTLFNALHMFPDSNSQLMEDMECKKELIYLNKDFLYRILIIHPLSSKGQRNPTKAYIFRTDRYGNEVELNPNGNVTSYTKVLEDEFLIDTNFLSLSQLGVENRGLVDMKPSERKKFIGSIMKDVEAYNTIYNSISKKANVLRSRISSITDKLKKLNGNKDINIELSEVEDKLDKLTNLYNKANVNSQLIEGKIKELDKDDTSEKIDNLTDNLNSLVDKGMVLLNKITALCSKYNIKNDELCKLGEMHKNISERIAEIEEKKNELSVSTHKLLLDKEFIMKQITEEINRLDNIRSDENMNKAHEELIRVNEEIKIISTMLPDNINGIEFISSTQYSDGIDALMEIESICNTVASVTNTSCLEEAISIVLNNKPYETPEDIMNKITDEKYKLMSLDETHKSLCLKLEGEKTLNKRPKECKINDCAFIKNVINIDYAKLKKEIRELEEAISKKNKYIDDLYRRYDYSVELSNVLNNVYGLKRTLKPNIHILKRLKIDSKLYDIDTAIKGLLTGYSFPERELLQSYLERANTIDTYNNLIRQREKYLVYEEKYNNMTKLAEEISDNINKLDIDANNMEENLNANKSKISEYEELLSQSRTLKSDIEIIRDYYNQYMEIKNEHLSVKEELDNLKNNNIELEQLRYEYNNSITEMNKYQLQIGEVKTKRDELLYNVKLAEEYKIELEEINNQYRKLEIIKKASSTSTGIQTVFMSLYMNRILEVANNLLSNLFNGEFSLDNFIIDNKEFRIPCHGNGIPNDDISSMSTSQKCMISLVLSFALLSQTSVEYDILKLDEIDGGLDNTNRSMFVYTLYRLMELLKSEQVFIISHNNEMNIDECDLILLKTSDTYNGNIIYNYNK